MKKPLVCSFCGRSEKEVEQMFASRQGVICSECVESAHTRLQAIRLDRQRRDDQALGILFSDDEREMNQIAEIIGKPIQIIAERDFHGKKGGK